MGGLEKLLDLRVDPARRVLAVLARGHRRHVEEERLAPCLERPEPEALAHPVTGHHVAGHIGGTLEIVLGACRDIADLLRPDAQRRAPPEPQAPEGLGIPGVGEYVARLLADDFGRLDRLMMASADEIGQVRGVGSIIAESVTRFFSDRDNRRVVERLDKAGVTTGERPAARAAGPLAGKTFVLTGALEGLSRDVATDLVERAGGRVTDSVSARTDYLVVGAEPGSKLDEARRFGVKLLDQRELMTMAGTP